MNYIIKEILQDIDFKIAKAVYRHDLRRERSLRRVKKVFLDTFKEMRDEKPVLKV